MYVQSGHGVDEKTVISILGNSQPEHRQAFRKEGGFFAEDERRFERWNDHHVKLLKHEFMRFKVHLTFMENLNLCFKS